MIPINVPLAQDPGLNLPIMVSAVMGVGVFGDHCSPVSNTTILASLATACDHIDHVRSQIPYALTAAVIVIAAYLFIGFIMESIQSLFNKFFRAQDLIGINLLKLSKYLSFLLTINFQFCILDASLRV